MQKRSSGLGGITIYDGTGEILTDIPYNKLTKNEKVVLNLILERLRSDEKE
jgi:hypothetical protein